MNRNRWAKNLSQSVKSCAFRVAILAMIVVAECVATAQGQGIRCPQQALSAGWSIQSSARVSEKPERPLNTWFHHEGLVPCFRTLHSARGLGRGPRLS